MCIGFLVLVLDLVDLVLYVCDNGLDGLFYFLFWNFIDFICLFLVFDDVFLIFWVQFFVQVGLVVFDVDDFNDELGWCRVYWDIFECYYLNWNMECLVCYNFEYFVIGYDDPVLDRMWEAFGLVEKVLYGDSMGIVFECFSVFF